MTTVKQKTMSTDLSHMDRDITDAIIHDETPYTEDMEIDNIVTCVDDFMNEQAERAGATPVHFEDKTEHDLMKSAAAMPQPVTKRQIQEDLSIIDRMRSDESTPSICGDKKRKRVDDVLEVDTDILRNVKSTKISEGFNHYNPIFVPELNRPPLPDTWDQNDIVFCHATTEEFVGKQKYGFHGTSSGSVPIVRLTGVTDDGNSVSCNVRGVTPYFYVNIPDGFDRSNSMRQSIMDKLNWSLTQKLVIKPLDTTYVLGVDIVRQTNMRGYNQPADYFKISCGLPEFIQPAASRLFWGIWINNNQWRFTTFENMMPFTARVMSLCKLKSCAWLKLPAGKYQTLIGHHAETKSQIEVDIDYTDLVPMALEGEHQKINIPGQRVLSFDIECLGKDGKFPDAKIDPTTQIGNYVNVGSHTIQKCVFNLGTCASIVGANVFTYEKEEDLLKGWSDYVRHVDPDMITGYNTDDFDLPYLLTRAETLGIDQFNELSRIKGDKCVITIDKFESKAYGKSERKSVQMRGRFMFDVLRVVLKDYKLGSYTLNNVSAQFLGEQKGEVPYSSMEKLQNGTEDDRCRLATYCLKDAYLPQRLIEKLTLLVNYIEMCRVTGVTISTLIMKGQQAKSILLMWHEMLASGYIMPDLRLKKDQDNTESKVEYEGATVLDPIKGFYDVPIATLDFASLYPSIMIAHNLCYTTKITKEQAMKMDPKDYTHTPPSPKYKFEGAYFVKAHIRQGLLPTLLRAILAARERAKKGMAGEKEGTMLYFVWNGRQLALKVTANSIYGLTGALKGMFPDLDISASVTAFGRIMIESVKALVESHYTKANGFDHDAIIVYG